jgi:hypothetical protein
MLTVMIAFSSTCAQASHAMVYVHASCQTPLQHMLSNITNASLLDLSFSERKCMCMGVLSFPLSATPATSY